MGALSHIVYASAATRDIEARELIDLLAQARRKNRELGITGMLLHSERSFFQVLEGEADTVGALFSRIAKDERHGRIAKIIEEPIAHRHFGDWSMAFTGASEAQLREIEGLNDFFRSGVCLADIDTGRAKKLLHAFANGRWRQSLGQA